MQIFVRTAEEIARLAHSKQFRRDGKTPYITHPQAVAIWLTKMGWNDYAIAAGWLHDILEDTDVKTDFLRTEGIPSRVIEVIELLTKQKDSDYFSYLVKLKKDPVAVQVKIADMIANLSDQPSYEQMNKYSKGLLFLLES